MGRDEGYLACGRPNKRKKERNSRLSGRELASGSLKFESPDRHIVCGYDDLPCFNMAMISFQQTSPSLYTASARLAALCSSSATTSR